MNDLEMTLLCAEAMGAPLMGSNVPSWNPLHDDAQAMALVKKCKLDITYWESSHGMSEWQVVGTGAHTYNKDLNRAICECVAKMQAAKLKP